MGEGYEGTRELRTGEHRAKIAATRNRKKKTATKTGRYRPRTIPGPSTSLAWLPPWTMARSFTQWEEGIQNRLKQTSATRIPQTLLWLLESRPELWSYTN